MLMSWIKSIIVFAVFASFVRYLLPDGKYMKYVQNTLGLIMILVVINPVVELFNLEDKLKFDYYYECLGDQVYVFDDVYYRQLMSQLIEEYVSENYGIDAQIEITYSGAVLTSLIVFLPMAYDSNIDQEKLRQDLCENFNLDSDVISIVEDFNS